MNWPRTFNSKLRRITPPPFAASNSYCPLSLCVSWLISRSAELQSRVTLFWNWLYSICSLPSNCTTLFPLCFHRMSSRRSLISVLKVTVSPTSPYCVDWPATRKQKSEERRKIQIILTIMNITGIVTAQYQDFSNIRQHASTV